MMPIRLQLKLILFAGLPATQNTTRVAWSAARCEDSSVDDHKILRLLLMKWSLPTLIAIAGGARRFSELRDSLQSVTARALTLFLKEAQAAGVVERAVVDGYPPAAEYRLAHTAKRLVPILKSLSPEAAPN